MRRDEPLDRACRGAACRLDGRCVDHQVETSRASRAARPIVREQLPAAAGKPGRPQRQSLGGREFPHAVVQRAAGRPWRSVRLSRRRCQPPRGCRASRPGRCALPTAATRGTSVTASIPAERDWRHAAGQLAGEPRATGRLADPVVVAQQGQTRVCVSEAATSAGGRGMGRVADRPGCRQRGGG